MMKIIDPKAITLFKGSYDAGFCGPEFHWYKINEKLYQIRYSASLRDDGDIEEQDEILVPIIQNVLGVTNITSLHKTSSKYYNILQIESMITNVQLTIIKEKMLKTKLFCIDK